MALSLSFVSKSMDLLLASRPLPHLPSSQYSPSSPPPPPPPRPNAAIVSAELVDLLYVFAGPLIVGLVISIFVCCLKWLYDFLHRLIYNAHDQTPASDIESLHHFHDHHRSSHDDFSLALRHSDVKRWIEENIEEAAPSFEFDRSRIEEGGLVGDMECVICLENIEDGEICRVFSECNHVFHKACIGSWLMKEPTCPICRAHVIRSC